MTTNSGRTTKPAVAVFGATGHTGRFVVAELLRRGIVPIAIARDLAALTAANFPGHEARGHETQGREILRRKASIDDMESLDHALDGAQAVINCAGPFLETADAVAAAALRAGIHYLDVTAEQPSVRATLDKYDIPAREAGIAVVPAMGFYGGFADLLVTAALGGTACPRAVAALREELGVRRFARPSGHGRSAILRDHSDRAAREDSRTPYPSQPHRARRRPRSNDSGPEGGGCDRTLTPALRCGCCGDE